MHLTIRGDHNETTSVVSLYLASLLLLLAVSLFPSAEFTNRGGSGKEVEAEPTQDSEIAGSWLLAIFE